MDTAPRTDVSDRRAARRRLHFSGIAGAGMNTLAQLMAARGHDVQGSDRAFDTGMHAGLAARLRRLGIELRPHDGTAIVRGIDTVVYSGAVEADTPELRAARQLGIETVPRAALLADVVNGGGPGVAVAGTSGKTTVTAMVGWILRRAGRAATILGGSALIGEGPGGCFAAGPSGGPVVAEADESDGTLVGYRPGIGVVLNVSRDHTNLDALHAQFARFLENSRVRLVNVACPEAGRLASGARVRTFGTDPGADIPLTVLPVRGGRRRGRLALATGAIELELPIPGLHNLENAGAAAVIAATLDVAPGVIRTALADFPGVDRRFEIIGVTPTSVRVVDDYAHNAAKIAAAIAAAQEGSARVVAVFQPHGFGPARSLRPELRELLPRILRRRDRFCYAEIYYGGGSVVRDMSSRILAEDLSSLGCGYAPDHEAVRRWVADEAGPGDTVLLMGARDPRLPDLARAIYGDLTPPARTGPDAVDPLDAGSR
jgi:UDP-N-acetylmuramate--alanine ligase